MPVAIMDATAITDMRTGALTAIGAKHLAPPAPRILGHVGSRGASYWNIRLLDRLFDFAENTCSFKTARKPPRPRRNDCRRTSERK